MRTPPPASTMPPAGCSSSATAAPHDLGHAQRPRHPGRQCRWRLSGKCGGGIYVGRADALTLTNATVSGNSAGYGGGIVGDNDATITLTNATVSGNSAVRHGGGIFGATDAAITLTNSTVSGNSAGHSGGGIFGNRLRRRSR